MRPEHGPPRNSRPPRGRGGRGQYRPRTDAPRGRGQFRPRTEGFRGRPEYRPHDPPPTGPAADFRPMNRPPPTAPAADFRPDARPPPDHSSVPTGPGANNWSFDHGNGRPPLGRGSAPINTNALAMFQPKPDTNVAQNGRLPFGPPTLSQDSQIKSHRDILRRHNEEYQLAQGIKVELSQAQAAFPSTFVGRMSKNNNTVIPVLPRLKNPDSTS